MSQPWRARHDTPAAIDLSRLNALVDGVYAVALTLLILNLGLPQDLSNAELARYWHALLPKALSFVLSFVMAGSAWIYVHQMSVLYERTNLGHLIRTVASLMFVCTLPMTAAALGAYPDSPWARRSIPPMSRCLWASIRSTLRCREMA